jgi:hypothetical protein
MTDMTVPYMKKADIQPAWVGNKTASVRRAGGGETTKRKFLEQVRSAGVLL